MTAPTASITDTAIANDTVADRSVLAASAHAWPIALRVAFRFVFVYFGFYVLTTQMLAGLISIPFLPFGIPDFGKIQPMQSLVMWVGNNLLNVKPTLIPTGSGDTLYDWTQAFTLVLIAAVSTTVWSWLDRERLNYVRLHKWFRLFIRFGLGTTMLSYGFAKFFPLQMPTIFLQRLLEPYGNFSPMGVLWYSIGAAPAYERFIGLAEIVAGALLFVPRTTLLGALMCLNVCIGIFMVNMTYDVPVKLFAFHLILFSVLLLAPECGRLFSMFVANRTVPPDIPPQFGRSQRANRIWFGAQMVYGAWILGSGFYQGPKSVKEFGADAPKSPFFGIWDIDSMAVNGNELPPLSTDSTRYRAMIFQRPTGLSFQRMDLTFLAYNAKIDTIKKTIALKRMTDSAWKSTLAYQRPVHEQLTLDGDVDGQRIHMRLSMRDLSKLNINRGFHWVQELPYNK
ncbi:MAG: DoxX family protein [Gemmatimonadaceae bacterium]